MSSSTYKLWTSLLSTQVRQLTLQTSGALTALVNGLKTFPQPYFLLLSEFKEGRLILFWLLGKYSSAVGHAELICLQLLFSIHCSMYMVLLPPHPSLTLPSPRLTWF